MRLAIETAHSVDAAEMMLVEKKMDPNVPSETENFFLMK